MDTISRLLESPYTALVAAFVLGGLGLSGKFTVTATHVLLAAAWTVVIVGLRGQPMPVIIGGGAIMAGALIILGFYFRPSDVPPNPKDVGKIETILDSAGTTIAARPIEIGNGGAMFVVLGQISDSVLVFFRAMDLKLEVLNGKVLVSALIRNEQGQILAELTRNEWKVAPNPTVWDRNYNDNTLEVKNGAGRIILQVRVLPDRIQLQGEWWSADGKGFRVVSVPGTSGGFVYFFGAKQKPTDPPFVQPLFAYPSDTHFGELLK